MRMLRNMNLARIGLLFLLTHKVSLLAQRPSSPVAAPAQLPRFELGFQATDMRTGCIGQKNCYLPSAALGVSAAINVTPHFAFEALWADTAQTVNGPTNQAGGHESELLAGVRSELRARHFGFYASGRLGYRRWSDLITNDTFTPPTATTPPSLAFSYGPRTDLAANSAGGFEVSPTSRLHLRGEIGDLLIDQGGQWTSNLQPSVGVSYGFGKPILWTPPRFVARESHPFFDKPNLAALTVNGLASTADNVTTYQFTRRGIPEGDPIARPLVKYGVPGQVSVELLESGILIAGMYGFHRLHQHVLERLIPFIDATGHSILAYRNTLFYSRSQPTR